MAVTSFKRSLFTSNPDKYISFLAGNAAFNPSSYESIATATGTGSSSTITFSSIPSTYKHLQIRILGKAVSVFNFGGTYSIRVNGDTGSNYAYHYLTGEGTTASASGAATQTSADWQGVMPLSGGSLTNMMGVGIHDFADYSSTTKNKTIRSFQGWNGNTIDNGYVVLASGLWMNTSAINSISLIHGNTWTSSTVVSLYGIKA